jgi:hypothetical protein
LLAEIDYNIDEEKRLYENLMPEKFLNEVVHILNHKVRIHNGRNQAVAKKDEVPYFEVNSVLTDCKLDFPQLLQLYL